MSNIPGISGAEWKSRKTIKIRVFHKHLYMQNIISWLYKNVKNVNNSTLVVKDI